MANLVLSGDTSGTVTLSAPAVSGSTTLTLPTTSSTLATLAAQTFTGTQTMTTLTSPASTALTLQSAGTTAITVSTLQNVGIGTTFPNSLLQVEGSFSKNTGDETTWGIRANDLTAMAAGVGGGLIFTGKYTTGGSNGIFGGIAGTKDNGTSGSGAGNLKLYSANSSGINVERIRLNSVGTVILQGGTTTSDGIGINFPATQSASSDANTLDDYEEGTFTPTASPSSGSYTTLTTGGWYVKVGRIVSVFAYWNVVNAGTAGGNWSLGGLPFTVINTGSFGAGNRGALMLAREDGVIGISLQTFWNGNSTNGQMQKYDGTNPSWTTGYVYIMSGTYETT